MKPSLILTYIKTFFEFNKTFTIPILSFENHDFGFNSIGKSKIEKHLQ